MNDVKSPKNDFFFLASFDVVCCIYISIYASWCVASGFVSPLDRVGLGVTVFFFSEFPSKNTVMCSPSHRGHASEES